jgi:hypothetical protein
MSNGSMVGAHVGVFWAGQNEIGDDCAEKMLKTMLVACMSAMAESPSF